MLHPCLPAALKPPRSLNSLVGNLPADLTPLVGRDELLEELCGLLSGSGLVTLLGPGGVGKTSLALHAGARLASRLPDGVWVVDLAKLSRSGEVPGAVAATLGLAERNGQESLETVRDALAARDALVVLDSAEHVRSGVAELVAAVRRPGSPARFLTTSQVALGLPGEMTVVVPTLPLRPALDAAAGPAPAPAVRLFAERAGAVDPSFRLDEETVALVTSICTDLDGLPLAIELAAARAEVLPVERIAAGLARRFELLAATPGRPLVARHATMAAALDRSVGLLSVPTQERFVRLGVFRAGFGLDAAVAVAGGGDSEVALAGSLAELRSHCLLAVERHGGETRYRMLETVREYATERLAGSVELEALLARHARHFAAVARRLASGADGPGVADLLDACELDLADHRQAFERLLATDPPGAATLVSDLRHWWTVRDSPLAGLRWAAEALSALGGDAAEPSEELVGLLAVTGTLGVIAGDHAAAERHLRATLDAAVAIGRRPPPQTLAMLATSAAFRGQRDEALRLARAALDAAASVPGGADDVERFFGATMALAGDGEAGFAMCRRAVDAARGSPLRLANSLANLSLAGVFLGSAAGLDVAVEAGTEAVAVARQIGSRYYEGGGWGALYGAHRRRGDRRSALLAAAEAMPLMLASGAVQYLTQLLHSLADDLVATDAYDAVSIASAAACRRAGPGASGTWEEVTRTRMQAAAGDRLGSEGFALAWDEGLRLGLDEVVLRARAAAEDAAAY